MVEILDMIEVKTIIIAPLIPYSYFLYHVLIILGLWHFYDKVQGVFFFNKFIEEKHLENDRKGDWKKKIQNCFLRIDSQ